MLEPRWVLELPPPKKSGAGKSDFKVMPCVKADVSGVVQPPREALSPLAGFAQLVSALAYGNKPDARSQSPTLRGTNPPPPNLPRCPKALGLPLGCPGGAVWGCCHVPAGLAEGAAGTRDSRQQPGRADGAAPAPHSHGRTDGRAGRQTDRQAPGGEDAAGEQRLHLSAPRTSPADARRCGTDPSSSSSSTL